MTSTLFVCDALPAKAASNDVAETSFVWVAPEGCPTAEEARARVQARLPSSALPVANAKVDRGDDRYRLWLEIPSMGERVIEAATCDELVASMAVVLAMSLTPTREPAVEERRSETTRATSAASPDPREEPLPTSASLAPTRVGVRGQAVLDAGTLPKAAAGAGIAVGIDPIANVHLEATTSLFVAQDGTLANDPSRGATFHLVTAGARGCWILLRRPEAGPCLGADLAVLSAHGFGSDVAKKATSVTWSPEASFLLRVRIYSYLRFIVGVGVAAPTSTPTFRIAGSGDVHRSSPISSRAWFGPELVF